MEELETKVMKIVADQFTGTYQDELKLTRDTRFIEDLNADSLDAVELVLEFEDEFELSIPDDDAERVRTIGEAIDYIRAACEKRKQ